MNITLAAAKYASFTLRMRAVVKLIIGVALAVVALTATLIVVALFPPVIHVLLLGVAVAFGWWGISGLRRGRSRFLSIFAVCPAPVMLVAALGAVIVFSPINHTHDSPTHGSPLTVEHSPSP